MIKYIILNSLVVISIILYFVYYKFFFSNISILLQRYILICSYLDLILKIIIFKFYNKFPYLLILYFLIKILLLLFVEIIFFIYKFLYNYDKKIIKIFIFFIYINFCLYFLIYIIIAYYIYIILKLIKDNFKVLNLYLLNINIEKLKSYKNFILMFFSNFNFSTISFNVGSYIDCYNYITDKLNDKKKCDYINFIYLIKKYNYKYYHNIISVDIIIDNYVFLSINEFYLKFMSDFIFILLEDKDYNLMFLKKRLLLKKKIDLYNNLFFRLNEIPLEIIFKKLEFSLILMLKLNFGLIKEIISCLLELIIILRNNKDIFFLFLDAFRKCEMHEI
jgi:hypothetical protein